ncbi:MAG: hydroxyacylglutathione hydrolase [Rhodobacteraceae bacterium]|nr:hydroxyacylglutathione hydrolase [Paracoccaceae bacterium]
MPLELVTVPCLKDNYAFLLHDPDSGRTALVDAPEAAPIRTALAERGWKLSDILITHHHSDHVAEVDTFRSESEARVWGAAADAHRLPDLDVRVVPGDPLDFAGTRIEVMDVPGHTIGHIAYYVPEPGLLFSGDSLMALGCGRLFEGSPAQMWDSLSRMAALPDDTLVCSGHEYTQANARFALSVEPNNSALRDRAATVAAARADGKATVPSTLATEKATNPFLRAHSAEIRATIGMPSAQDVDVFARVRQMKDVF